MGVQGGCRLNLKRVGIAAALLTTAVALDTGSAGAAITRLTDGGNTTFHQTIAAAFNSITGDTPVIAAQAGTFRGNLDIDRSVTVKLKGGYNGSYAGTVGMTAIEGELSVSYGSLELDRIAITSAPADPVRIIYLHHSTGNNVWYGGVPEFISSYNSSTGANFQITERAYPDSPYPWENYPYDYWKLWVDTTGETGYLEQDTLDTLAANYDVIVFKHCFPVSDIEADTGAPDIASSRKSLENYQLQYNALKTRLRQFPDKKFIVWTGAALTEAATMPENAERARQFFSWVRNSWDETGDNIFVWDFWTLETGGGLYLTLENAASSGDSHPNGTFSAAVAPLVGKRIVDVIEGGGDSGSITGD
ncbi:hypothetical protein OR1_01021 [Geobacter sp. OR-1]|uniref:hypothetical protein n=1 Tax=Geobacter sp. OR-1 TaxID=1266765 RepID=UPI000542EC6E|nr:hypothetical protein [Geobacter sp. OR-1]GAM08747.1 hypothetical protein OR1_01021 [Geobacter sp. OR-1]